MWFLMNKCKECELCCKGDNAPAVSLNELNALPNPRAKKIGDELYRLEAPCQYHSLDGCTLEDKPLACELYPFYPVKGGFTSHKEINIGWVVKTSCPHWTDFDKDDLENVKKIFGKKREEFKTELVFN
jgi:Fe-S-cluster containining protein